MDKKRIKFSHKSYGKNSEPGNGLALFTLGLIVLVFIRFTLLDTQSNELYFWNILFVFIFIITLEEFYSKYTFVEILEEGIKFSRIGIWVNLYKWDEIKSIGYEEIYLHNRFEPQIYMYISCDDKITPTKRFIKKRNTKNYLAFAVPSEEVYLEIAKKFDQGQINQVNSYCHLPSDYTISPILAGEIAVHSLILLAIIPLIALGEYIYFMIWFLLLYFTVTYFRNTIFYHQYQIDNRGIKRICFNKSVEDVPWSEMGDIVIKTKRLGSDYSMRYETRIFICFEEQDVRDGKLHISWWAGQGESHFYMDYNKRNLDLITKYYPKYMIKGPVK